MAQEAILSMFLYHLEGALSAGSPTNGNSYPTTAFMQADDEDDVKFIERLLTLKNGGDTSDNIEISSNKRPRLERHCCATFMANFHINVVQNSDRIDGKVDAIAVTIPAMTSNGLMYCITSSRGYSQQIAEADVSVRVRDNVDVDDWSLTSAELYGDSTAYECEDIMDENWQQQEYISSPSVSSQSSSVENDMMASLPAYVGSQNMSRNTTSRIRMMTSLPFQPSLTSCSMVQIRRFAVNNNIDEDLGLFSDSYGELLVDWLPTELSSVTAVDVQGGSPPLLGTRRITKRSKYDTSLSTRKHGMKIVSRNRRRNTGFFDRYSLQKKRSQDSDSKFRKSNRAYSRLLNCLKRERKLN